MEDRDQILIDRYLAGELTEAELRDLQHRRENDPAFDQDLRSLEEARNALRLKEREALRERFRSRDALLDKKKPVDPVRNRKTMYILWLAAAVILLVVAWKFIITPSKPTEPVISESKDSIHNIYPPAVTTDTIHIEDSTAANQKQLPEKKMDMAKASNRGAELFAEYYKPYKDAIMDPSTRGDDTLTHIQKFQKAYWDGDYEQAVQLFPGLSDSYRNNQNFQFMDANALLAVGQTDLSILLLKDVIEKNNSRYKVEARYALSLAYLSKHEMHQAAEWLENYLSDTGAKQKEAAAKLQKELKPLIPK